MNEALLQTDLGSLPLTARGKVRDIYTINEKELLFVATDRISAFDHVLGSGIPDKGRILTQLSRFWFDYLADVVPNHLLSADTRDYPAQLQPYAAQLEGRSMIVKRAEMFPVECVVRGYLSGSGWKDYLQTGAVCGIQLPTGLRESDRLPEPIFTPAAKNTVGHDENISFQKMVDTIGQKQAESLRTLTLAIYEKARKHSAAKGLILADTKFEFGLRPDGTLVLADEVLTPDSSRFWDAATWQPGVALPSFDKQFVRDWLTKESGWDKASDSPPPPLPDEVVAATRAKYVEAYEKLTGRSFAA